MSVINEYLRLLFELFQYDVAVLSQPWMYYCLLVPVMFYLMFFFAKWAVLTAPIWVPAAIVGKVVEVIILTAKLDPLGTRSPFKEGEKEKRPGPEHTGPEHTGPEHAKPQRTTGAAHHGMQRS